MTKVKGASSEIVRTESIGWQVKQVGRIMDATLKEGLKPLGVTTDQFMVVMTLLEFEGISQSEICKKVDMPSYAMTRNLDALEKSGFLKRHPDEKSRRSFCIRLTSKGKELGPQLFNVVNTVNARVLGNLTGSEAKALSAALNKVIRYSEE